MRFARTILMIYFFSLSLPPMMAQDVFTFSTPTGLADNTVTEIPLAVSGIATVMDASYGLEKICLDITHTFVGDLTIWLRSPQGTEVLLTDQNGGGGQNYTVTCFDGVSGTSITSGSAPFNGSFLPEEPLGLFNSGTENPNGSWVLKVQDQFPGDVGTLQSFSLTFSNMPAMVAGAQNNDCSSSQMVTVNQSYTCTILENVTLSGATASGTPESCAFPANTFDDDIWFVFTASTSDQEVRITNEQGSPADLVFEVLEGSCGSLTSLLCHDDPDIGAEIGDLTAGNSYYLRIASKSSGLNTTFDLCIKEAIPDPPSNDDCAGAIEVSTSSCIPVAGTVAGATFSGPGVSCPFTIVGNFNDDVWYAFQPTESSHEFNVTNVQGTSTALDYQILSSSGSCSNLSEIFCHSESGSTHKFIVGGLNIGAQYYLRVATFQTTAQNTKFDICINPLGASSNPHDECSSAGSIPISNGLSCTSTITGTLLDATPSAEAQACSATIAPFNDDVWFSFTAVQDTYDLKVSNITGQAPDLIFEVLSGNSCASLTSILCHDDPDELVGLSGLTQGQQYFVRIASYSTSPQTTSFDLCLTDNTPPPANDECAGAIEIIPSAGATCTSSQNGTLAAATASSVPQTCPFTGTAPFDDDVWFFFTATETSHQIDVTNISGSTTDLIYEIFSGSCGSLSSIRCHDDPNSEIILSNLVVNDPYFIRVASYPTTGQTTTFSICVKSAPTPPANDECTGATTLTIVDTSCNATSASLVGATPSTQAETCQIQPFFNDIWFSFTANQPKQIIDLSNIVDRPQQLIGQISSGQCGTLIQHSCFDIPDSENNPVHVLENLVPGTSYFLRMASYDISALSTTFDICIRDTVPDPPANDECATAVAITVSTGATCTSTVSGTLLGATSSGAASSCPSGGSFDDDVWFSFVATETTHEIILKNISGSTLDLDVQVSSGSCGALAQITCHRAPTPDDSTGFALSGLTMGNTYYIRVATFPNDLQTTTFDICVRTPVELCSLLVTNTNNSGPGSLRFAIECSETGDTIRFDATVFNMTIAIDTPGIIVPHQLLLESQFDDNITISNVDINNSDVLVNIQGDLTLWGLRLTGLSAESLIIKVEPTGSINLIDCQLNRVTLDN